MNIKKKVVKKLSILIALCTLAFSTNVFAMDSRVISSDAQMHFDEDNDWASGQVTADENHSCNVKHFRYGSVITESGRRWGTGWVYNSTAANKQAYDGIMSHYWDNARVYYDFD